MRKIMITAFGALLALALFAPAAGAVNVPKTTGSVEMSYAHGPLYMSYSAFPAVSPAAAKGNVSYTSFGDPMSGTGVWVPEGSFTIAFDNGSHHALTVTSFDPTSPTSLTFSGTGYWVEGPSWTETFTGTINGSTLSLTLVPDAGVTPIYWDSLTVSGLIATLGAISGSWATVNPVYSGAFTITGGVHEVFHYTAPVTAATVTGDDAMFRFLIPAGFVGPDPYELTVSVHDGGSPGVGYDTIGWLGTNYPIVSGNLTVFA